MAKKINLKIDQATTFSRQITAKTDAGVVIDLTGYTVESLIKKSFASFVGYEFNVVVDDAVNGLFTISLTPVESAAIPADRYVYDIRILDGSGNATRIVEGLITVTPAVTAANPFVVVDGVKITDPRIVHVHENFDVLALIQDISQIPSVWKKVDTDNYVVSNGDRLMVDTTVSIINLIVPDQPTTDYLFTMKVMDLKDNFGVNKVVVKNQSNTVIYEGDVNGESFEIVWTSVDDGGYKIIQ